jgi:hypothetical protein
VATGWTSPMSARGPRSTELTICSNERCASFPSDVQGGPDRCPPDPEQHARRRGAHELSRMTPGSRCWLPDLDFAVGTGGRELPGMPTSEPYRGGPRGTAGRPWRGRRGKPRLRRMSREPTFRFRGGGGDLAWADASGAVVAGGGPDGAAAATTSEDKRRPSWSSRKRVLPRRLAGLAGAPRPWPRREADPLGLGG